MRKKSMKLPGFFLAFLALVLVIGTSSAEIYRWVDEKGVVHFSDSPTQHASETSVKENVSSPDPNPEENVSSPDPNPEEKISSPDPNPEGNSPPTSETRTITLNPDFFKPLDEGRSNRVSVNAPTVEIYETNWCGYCKKAKEFFRSRGIKFKSYNIENDAAAARRMMTLTRRRAVPFVVINGQPIQGYSEQAYEQALRN
jgi:glutaredoxin-like YruB-family protein